MIHAENGIHEAALFYPTCGWQVLPCKPRTKQPLTQHGLKDASTDKEVIDRWWKAAPLANVAIRCGLVSAGLVVIDVDGEEGKESLKGKHLPPTIMARTGGGGAHYFYYYKGRLRPKVGLLPKVDLRAEDSYVVAPPSIHPSGAAYEWIVSPEQASPAPLPEWVIKIAQAPKAEPTSDPSSAPEGQKPSGQKARLGRSALEFIANGAPMGEQRDRAVRAARNLLEAGYSPEATTHKIWLGFRACQQNADEPWTFKHAVAIAQDLASKPAPPLKPLPEEARQRMDATRPQSAKPSAKGKIQIISAPQLLKMEFPPIVYVVEGIIPEGLSIIGAKPKIGKTWMMLDVALASAYGGIALAARQARLGTVLYMALEDGERRIQSRLRLMVGRMQDSAAPANLYFTYRWPRIDEGGLEHLAAWMDLHPDTKLIIVDTLKRIRPKEKGGRTLYSQDYDAIAPLADFAHERNVSIIIVMHTRKMEAEDALDMLSGSTGLSGAADHVMILRRARNQGEATLQLIGRDGEEQELALLWKAPQWELVGTAKDVRISKERKEVIDVLLAGKNVPATPKDIADKLGKDPKNIKPLMWYMAQDGLLVAMGGFYSVADSYIKNANRANSPTLPTQQPANETQNDSEWGRI